jgi:hypothetical protein
MFVKPRLVDSPTVVFWRIELERDMLAWPWIISQFHNRQVSGSTPFAGFGVIFSGKGLLSATYGHVEA